MYGEKIVSAMNKTADKRLSGGRRGQSTLILKTKVYSDSDKSQFGISDILNPSLNEV